MDKRLLILDDDLAVADVIRIMAEKLDFDVITVDDPEQLHKTVAGWEPTHIMIDLVMPRVDGVEVLLELARRDCRASIIIVSGADARVLDAAHRIAEEHGLKVLGTLAKPFRFLKFKAMFAGAPNAVDVAAFGAGPASFGGVADIGEAELRNAVKRREIAIAFQPKVRRRDQALSGFEALARWTHPTLGPIPPGVFIPLAEKSGLIDELTEVVFDNALDWLRSAFPISDVTMAINISARSFGDSRLADQLAAAARRKAIDTRRIILEVTETAAMADPATTVSLATRLRLKGFQLSIDDFGVGYSSLTQLARLPFSELKVDMSFTRNLTSSQESRKIVKAIIGLGHSLGLEVTAEGVEDGKTLDLLADMNCDIAQGYFIGRPMPKQAIDDWMKQRELLTVKPPPLDRDA